jgi:hypothetical protein
LTELPLSAHTAHALTHAVAEGLMVLDVAPHREEILAKMAMVATGQPWRPIMVWPWMGPMSPPARRRRKAGGPAARKPEPSAPAGPGSGGKRKASGAICSRTTGSCRC